MTYPRTVTLALLLLCLSCSHLPSEPRLEQPALERSAQKSSAVLIRKAEVSHRGTEMVVVLWSPLDMQDLGRSFDVQAMFDTDQNPETYPYANYVARVLERSGSTFPVRIGPVDEFDPGAPGGSGWGEIVGYGTLDDSRHRLELHIPLAALGNDDGTLDWEVDVYKDLECAIVRGTTP